MAKGLETPMGERKGSSNSKGKKHTENLWGDI